jgi:uncharacterized protein YjbJ (UPF0337 family)
MNWDRIEGNWKQVKGKVKEQWGQLTDDDFDVVAGRRDQLAGKIQERYGVAKDEAEKQVAAWERSATAGSTATRSDRRVNAKQKGASRGALFCAWPAQRWRAAAGRAPAGCSCWRDW